MRKLLKAALGLVVLAFLVVVGLVAYASLKTGRPIEVAYPPIQADRSPQAVARGRSIFLAVCQGCHQPAGESRAVGGPMADAPAFLGRFYASNLTSHKTAGIGSARDEELARIIRYGVNRWGFVTIMPASEMGDADLAAVLGFLRSDDPLLASDERTVSASQLTVLGKVILVLSGAATPPQRPASGIPVPAKGLTPEYGRYLVRVLDCGGCHTAGFSPDKVDGEEAFAGGFELADAAGAPILTSNITFHETGIAGWTLAQFQRAVRDGLRPDGTVLRYPMPKVPIDDLDLEAAFLYLKSVPPRPAVAPRAPGKAAAPAVVSAGGGPEALFASLGCGECHGPGRRHEAVLSAAVGRDPEQVARFIRNPQQLKPGAQMPTYESRLDEEGARSLARWIIETRGRVGPGR